MWGCVGGQCECGCVWRECLTVEVGGDGVRFCWSSGGGWGMMGMVAVWKGADVGSVGGWRWWQCGMVEMAAIWKHADGGSVGGWRRWQCGGMEM